MLSTQKPLEIYKASNYDCYPTRTFFAHCSLSLEKATGNIRKIINWGFGVNDLLLLLCICHVTKEKQERVLPRYREEKKQQKWNGFCWQNLQIITAPFRSTSVTELLCAAANSPEMLLLQRWNCQFMTFHRARGSCPQRPNQERRQQGRNQRGIGFRSKSGRSGFKLVFSRYL